MTTGDPLAQLGGHPIRSLPCENCHTSLPVGGLTICNICTEPLATVGIAA